MEADPDPRPARGVPDVTVVIPVFNTMPYLTACLQSMVDQTIGADRMEVVAVDDGSTDGSGEELDRFARSYPALFRVVHQENSGGPAGPCNRALDLSAGRYVFFLGADDYLADYALEKMVDRADAWESDVVMGRIVGVGGRRGQTRFTRDEREVPFPHSQLPFALGNTKMFRRSLVEEHRLRYPLDLRVGSDQPFTIAAMLHARRISVLADEPYYYGIRREDSSNITFSSGWRARLEDIGMVMRHVAELLPPGEDRDQILHRHFTWEIDNRIRLDLLHLAEAEQRQLCAAVARLADEYLTEGVSRRLSVDARLRIRLAQAGRLDRLRDLLRAQAETRTVPLVLGKGRALLAAHGYGELPDDWFESHTENLPGRLDGTMRATALNLRGPVLELTAAGTALHPDSRVDAALELRPLPGAGTVAGPVRRSAGDAPGPEPAVRVPGTLQHERAGGIGFTLRVVVDLELCLPPAQPSPGRQRWAPRLVLDAGEQVFDLPLVAADSVPRETAATVRTGTGRYRLLVRVGRNRRLVIVCRHLPPDDVPRRARLRARLGRLRARL